MSAETDVARAADEILYRLRDLRGPKDAAMALLVAHVQMTKLEELNVEQVETMLGEYRTMFKLAYFEPRG